VVEHRAKARVQLPSDLVYICYNGKPIFKHILQGIWKSGSAHIDPWVG